MLALVLAAVFSADDIVPKISFGERDEHGEIVHRVESPYQSGVTEIRVLLPDALADGETLPVIYVLPVEAGRETRYGDGLTEIRQAQLLNQHRAVYVAPTFAQLPWYADHPTDPLIRQETYLLKVVLPFVEQTYPVRAERSGRLLLGFSKSGWGAWSLLLRHPEVFDRAAAWDAPLMLDRPGKYDSGPIFGDDVNFEKYRISDLVSQSAERWRGEPRLILTGYGNFREEQTRMQALLEARKIPHVVRDGPARKHDWHSGWVAEAVELLMTPANKSP